MDEEEGSAMNESDKVIYDMPNADYHRGEWQREYASSTSLKKMAVSPKYFRWCRENGGAQISLKASLEGSVYHSMLASLANTGCLEEFQNEYFVFEPPVNPKTGAPYGITSQAYQMAYDEALAANPGREACSQAEVDLAARMVDELTNHCGNTSRSVQQLLQWGKAEVSHFTEYEGVKFKFRTDLITKNKIVDWKTISSEDLHEDTIIRQITKCGYGFSAAFYQFFHLQMFGEFPEFYWVFQQKEPPFDAVLVSAAPFAYSRDFNGTMIPGPGALEFERVRDQYISCQQTGRYMGAEIFIPKYAGRRIMQPAIPGYIRNNVSIFYEE